MDRQAEQALAYADHFEHLADELQRLDLLLQQQVTLFRAQTQPFQRLAADRRVYISHEEIDWLLGNEKSPKVETREADGIRRRLERFDEQIQARVAASLEQGLFLPLVQLTRTFGLSSFEVQTLVICLAPELQRKYDRLYAYLQDDITRKKPSVDLVLTLLCPTPAERWREKARFSAQAPLFRAGMIRSVDDPQNPSGSSDLGRSLRLDGRVLNYLLGNNQLDDSLVGLAAVYWPTSSLEQVLVESAAKAQMARLLQRYFLDQGTEQRRVVVYLHGPAGVGKRELALATCASLHCPLLVVDLEWLLAREPEAETPLRLVFRESLLLQAALFLDHLDGLLGEEPKAKVVLKRLSQVAGDYGWLVFLAGEKPWNPGSLFERMVFQAIALSLPEAPLREAAWGQVLAGRFPTAEADWAGQLANQFRLTPGQIRAAAALAESESAALNGGTAINLTDLYAACRRQSNQKLSELAVKIEPRYGWPDIVLPENKRVQLKEICSQARHRYREIGRAHV